MELSFLVELSVFPKLRTESEFHFGPSPDTKGLHSSSFLRTPRFRARPARSLPGSSFPTVFSRPPLHSVEMKQEAR